MKSLDLSIRRRTFLAGLAGTTAFLAAPAILTRRAAAAGEINLYSSRHYDTDDRLYSDFTAASGIKINRIEANPDELIERMRAEGSNSPADVFLSVDAGRIERARELGLLQAITSEALSKAVPGYLRDDAGFWYGFSKRARVIMVAKDRVADGAITTYEDLADPKFKGKVLTRSSTNIYSQSLAGAVLAALGEAKTEEWAKGVVANMARPPRGGDTDQIKAVAAGEGDIAISNTYYLANLIKSGKPENVEIANKIRVVFPNQADRGTHVNISGGGVAASAPNKAGAIAFLEYLVTPAAQKYFAEGNNEYPVLAGVSVSGPINDFGTFKEDQLNAAVFARNNAAALQIMDRAGWK